MKKFFVGVFSVLMLVVISGCSNGNSTVEGNWYIVSDGEITTLILDDDGTGKLNSKDVTYEYKDKKIVLMFSNQSVVVVANVKEDDTTGVVMKTSDDKIYAYQDKDEAKKAAEKQKEEIGEQQETNSASDFIGTWDGISASYNGQSIDLDETSLEISITINSNKTVTATTNGEADGSGTWAYNSTTNKLTITDTTNNKITCYISDGKLKVPMERDGEQLDVTLQKR